MSHTLDIQHFVFGTRGREHTISLENREALYRFLWTKLKELKCHLYRINGVGDHVHIVVNLHPDVSKAELIKILKTSSSQWMKKCGLFPEFRGWCDGYFSESKDPLSLERVISYVKAQEKHHLGENFVTELSRLHHENYLTWDERDLK